MRFHPPRFIRRVIALFTWGARDLDMDQEMAFHVESITREYVRAGMSEAEAARAARGRFGSVLRLKEQGHDVRGTHLEQFMADVRSGLRQLTNAPVFALVAAITLALGIGANAAVFAVVKSVLLDALPYPDADRLVRVYGRLLDGSQERGPLSAGTVNDIAERQLSFASRAAFMDVSIEAVYGSDDGPQISRMTWVEPEFFQTLGVAVQLGRTFRREDALSGLVPLSGGQLAPDAASAVVMTHTAPYRVLRVLRGYVVFVGRP